MKKIHTNNYNENIETNDICGSEEIDVDYEDAKEEKIIDNLNKAGLVELGKRVQAMTDDEKKVVSENIPIELCFERIKKEIKDIEIADKCLCDCLSQYNESNLQVNAAYDQFTKELIGISIFTRKRRNELSALKQSLADILEK